MVACREQPVARVGSDLCGVLAKPAGVIGDGVEFAGAEERRPRLTTFAAPVDGAGAIAFVEARDRVEDTAGLHATIRLAEQ